jgi:hypothetical protein
MTIFLNSNLIGSLQVLYKAYFGINLNSYNCNTTTTTAATTTTTCSAALNTLQLFIYNTLRAVYFYLNTTGTFYLHT